MRSPFTTTGSKSRSLAKMLGGRGRTFCPISAVFPLAILVYLVCFTGVLVGVNHIHRQTALFQQQQLQPLFDSMMARRFLLQNNNTNTPSVSIGGDLQNYIHERPVADAPPIFLAIPTVPRAKNADYLLKVLQSLENANFPLDHTFVFYNGNPQVTPHERWNQGETLFTRKGVRFLWNDAPVPPPHPAAYDNSLPLPPEMKDAGTIHDARNDTVSRKDWRRKECHDFRIISQHMLQVVYNNNNSSNNSNSVENPDQAWIIFNQDDAQWLLEFYYVYEKLMEVHANKVTTRYDLSRQGLVSVAFRAHFLKEIVEKGKLWCDFVPVDWMVWSCEDDDHQSAKAPLVDNWIRHIGKVSSREGVVEEPPQTPAPVKSRGYVKKKGEEARTGAVNT